MRDKLFLIFVFLTFLFIPFLAQGYWCEDDVSHCEAILGVCPLKGDCNEWCVNGDTCYYSTITACGLSLATLNCMCLYGSKDDTKEDCGPKVSGTTCYYGRENYCTYAYPAGWNCTTGSTCSVCPGNNKYSDCLNSGCSSSYCKKGSCGATCAANADCPTGQCCDLSNCTCGACPPSPCSDSDGGKNYTVKGECKEKGVLKGTDSCSGDTLTEWYCDGNICKSETKNCNDYDCSTYSDYYAGCKVSGDKLELKGDDYRCGGGYCLHYTNEVKTCEGPWTCTSCATCSTQKCLGTPYHCYTDNSGNRVWSTSYLSRETNCTDGCDNDCDGAVDKKDTDCINCSDYTKAGDCDGTGVCRWCPNDKTKAYSSTDTNGTCKSAVQCQINSDCSATCDGNKKITSYSCAADCSKCNYTSSCVKDSCGATCDASNPCTTAGYVCDTNVSCQCVPCDKKACEVNTCTPSKSPLQPGEEFNITFNYTPGISPATNIRKIYSPWGEEFSNSSAVTPCAASSEKASLTAPTVPGTYTYEAWCDYSYQTCSITVADTTPPGVSANCNECFYPTSPTDYPLISWSQTDGSGDVQRYDVCYLECSKWDGCIAIIDEAKTAGDRCFEKSDDNPGAHWKEVARNLDGGAYQIKFNKGKPVNLYFFQIKAKDKNGNSGWTSGKDAYLKIVDKPFSPTTSGFYQSSPVPTTLNLTTPQTIYLDVPQGATVTSAPIEIKGSSNTGPKDLTVKIGESEVYKYTGKFAYEQKGTYGLTPTLLSQSGDGYYTKTGTYTAGDQELKDTRTVDFTHSLQQLIGGKNHRRPIELSYLYSQKLTDYQILITLDTASLISVGKMRSDCGDIRFTDSDGSTQLNYWLESGCNSASTKIWVKVPSVPAGSKTIYIYYGNPSASSASNGTNTFLFFDDFSGSLSKWTTVGGTPSILDGYLLLDSDGEAIRSNSTYSHTWTAVGGRFKVPGAVDVKFGWDDDLITTCSPIHDRAVYHPLTNGLYTLCTCGSTGSVGGCRGTTTGTPYTQNAWNKWEIALLAGYNGGSSSVGTIYKTEGYQWNLARWCSPNNPLYIWAQRISGGNLLLDDIYVRKYASSEPTTSIGVEETLELGCTCPGCSISGNDCFIPIKISSKSAGKITLSNLNINSGAITTFSDGSSSKTIEFTALGTDTTTAKIKILKTATITSAKMDMKGALTGGIVDQKVVGVQWNWISSYIVLGQTFTTGGNVRYIHSIDVTFDPSLDTVLTLWNSPAKTQNLGQSSNSVNGSMATYKFTFSSQIPVSPSTQYYFETIPGSYSGWEFTAGDTYAGGSAYINGNQKTYDLAFTTYYSSFPLSPTLDIGNDGSLEWKFGYAEVAINQDLVKPVLKIKPTTDVANPTVWLNGVKYQYSGTLTAGTETSFDISASLKKSAENVLNFDSSANLDWTIFDFKRETFNPGGILKDVKLRLKRTAPITTSISGGHGYDKGTPSHSHTIVIDGTTYTTVHNSWSHTNPLVDSNYCCTWGTCGGDQVPCCWVSCRDYYWDYGGEHSDSLIIDGKTYLSSSGSHRHQALNNCVYRDKRWSECRWYGYDDHASEYSKYCTPTSNQCYSGDHSHTFNIPPFNNPSLTMAGTKYEGKNGTIIAGDKGWIEISLPEMENKDYSFVFGADTSDGFKWEIVGNKYSANPDTDFNLQVNGELTNQKITFVGQGLPVAVSSQTLKLKPTNAGNVYLLDSSHQRNIRNINLYFYTAGMVAPKCHIKINVDGSTVFDENWGYEWGSAYDWTTRNILLNPSIFNGKNYASVQYWVTGSYVYEGVTRDCASGFSTYNFDFRLDYALSVPSRNPSVTVSGETKSAGELKDNAVSTQTLTKLTQGVNYLDFSTIGPKNVLDSPYKIDSTLGSGKFNWKIIADLSQIIDLSSEINQYLRGCTTATCTVPITFSGTGSEIGFSSVGVSYLSATEPICSPFNNPPTVENLSAKAGCIWPLVRLYFTYTDLDGIASDPMSAYEVQIDDNASTTDGYLLQVTDMARLEVGSSTAISVNYALPIGENIAVKTIYYWRVKVKDSNNNWSDWAEGMFDLHPM